MQKKEIFRKSIVQILIFSKFRIILFQMGCSHPQQDVKLTLIQADPDTKQKGNIQSLASPATIGTSNDLPPEKHQQSGRDEQKKMSQEEKNKMYSSPLFDRQMTAFIDRVFQTYDTKKNGVLSIDEFARLLRQYNSPKVITDQQAEQLFKIADLNQDKVISKSELRFLYTTLLKY